ncbi:OmpA family protein [Spongiivirga citrea]|uniref:OmpA family protein n=1 Tax=Spongiivirga citrea TaxID=1481457 RepID=A0A6M0CMF1_9FLAO|nr:OmpA family protein [Spongiivirga citrea]NER19116.1 OmpA family protein [Spongiivirga citrea]
MRLFSIWFICTFSISTVSFAQSGNINAANKKYDRFAYANAIKIYEKLLDKGYQTPDLYQKLASSYYFTNNMDASVRWYDSIAKQEETMQADDYFRYSQALRSKERYQEADSALVTYYAKKGDDYRVQLLQRNSNYLAKIKEQSGRYTIQSLDFNSGNSDFAPSFYKDRLVFASARDSGVFTRIVDKRTNKPFLELYEVKLTKSGKHSRLKKLKGINSRFHESSSVFNKKGNRIWFTRNNFYEGEYKRDKKGINRLKIFTAVDSEFGWEQVSEIQYNSNQYSVAHPAFSPDGKTMFFVSDRPGGHGKSDLWMAKKGRSGLFGKPINLGKDINTSGRETFPFVSDNGDLFFASDGHAGLGGLDVFVAPYENETYSAVYNVGEPVNSVNDDFSFIINDETNIGYVASNREGGKGDDDIYRVNRLKPLVKTCTQQLIATVQDSNGKTGLNNVQVEVLNEKGESIGTFNTDANGSWKYSRNCKENTLVRFTKEGYQLSERYIPINTLGSDEVFVQQLEPVQQLVDVGQDLGKLIKLNPIYFDNNKSNVRKDAAFELVKIAEALLAYPDLQVEVGAHTDSRGKDKYNLKLSQKRAESIVKFLVKNGVEKSRLTAKGYGETKPINECVNDVPCSEAKIALNRRSEFIIVGRK